MKTYSIGRNPKSDIVINKESVSNDHAELTVLQDKLIIKDKQSSNGIWINRRRVLQAVITNADELLIANQKVELFKYLRIIKGEVIGIKSPDDYTDQFSDLIAIEKKYELENEKVEKSAGFFMAGFRISFLGTAISGILIRMFIEDGQLMYILISTVIFGFISLFFFIQSNKAMRVKDKKKKVLRDQLKIEYICPCCHNSLLDSTYMMSLKEEYRCKFCKGLLYKKTEK
jgi:hypothetical protein